MAKFSEIVYMVMDLLKENSDDAFYTEEHILFVAKEMRALLLERKYRGSRNMAFAAKDSKNAQTICLSVDPAEVQAFGCSGNWLKSNEKVPELLNIGTPEVYPVSNLVGSVLTYISPERMPYVGYNKWLCPFAYVTRGEDGYLYIKGRGQQFLNLENVKMTAVFDNPMDAANVSCSSGSGDGSCDILDQEFPLEEALVQHCIELTVQELSGARYAPKDEHNNDNDDLSGLATSTRSASPARRSAEQVMEEQQ